MFYRSGTIISSEDQQEESTSNPDNENATPQEVEDLLIVTPQAEKEEATPKSRGKKRCQERDDEEQDLGHSITDLIKAHKENKAEKEKKKAQKQAAEGVEESFFFSCIQRMKLLPAQTKSVLQFQIQQLFFNAENPHLPSVPIMPLPPQAGTSTQTTIPPPVQQPPPVRTPSTLSNYDYSSPTFESVCGTSDIIATAMNMATTNLYEL